ncbi:MAG: DNA-formamidopyrimidine glycosylase [Cycloclasticus sp. symbiont of Poecilosclerida sp. M]|nr:MAG: DNA-formamidopyrimidine glycosylase [Cycloclasticus sp. symbiont of Poecilosclerida sp. M]
MPELPEVETTRRGITPHIQGHTIARVIVRNARLRWPVSPEVTSKLPSQVITGVERRAKYLFIHTAIGSLIIHLGMSGSLRVTTTDEPPEKHDHIDIIMDDGNCLRYRDPRRFGCFLWTEQPTEHHKLIQHLGPEPFNKAFNLNYFHAQAKTKKTSIKQFIIDGKIVVGVGNIYASEALFLSGIHPKRAANKVSKKRLSTLLESIKKILALAIEQGGTTLKDFVNSEGKPGYFQQTLSVYGRAGKECFNCESRIKQITLGQRSTFYCPRCQH